MMKRITRLGIIGTLLVVGALPARAQVTQAQFDSLRSEIAQIKAWKAAIDLELGPVVDPGAQTIRARIRELGVAFNGVVARMEGIPGGETIVDAIREGQLPIIMKLPPAGRTVQEYVNSAIVAAGTGSGAQGPPGPPGGSGVTNLPGLGQGLLFNHGVPGNPNYTSVLFGSGEYAWRLLINARGVWDGQPICSDCSRPLLRFEVEQDNAWSFGYDMPNATGPFDGKPGKPLLFRPGGVGSNNERGPTAMIYSGLVGRGLQLGVARNAPNIVSLFDFNISGTDGTNPISITLGGAERRLKPCTIGGQNVVCF